MRINTTTTTLLLLCTFAFTNADITWPKYSQQCRDDAGPPYGDDEETFPNGKYHDGSPAIPVLLKNGQCAEPMKKACNDRPTFKTAYIEGPIDCGNKGWYCRIMPDPNPSNWPPLALTSDVNFGHCNSTDGFEDGGFDQNGHCHGSSKDNTYYWWIRDHWYRQYNGHLRCCCGWGEDSSNNPVTDGRIANRCDYRRMVSKNEDLSKCRDANEEDVDNNPLTLSYEGGCKARYKDQIGKPIPEDDSICWEIQYFGEPGDDDNEDDDEDEDCKDSTRPFLVNKKKKTCAWVANDATTFRCSKGNGSVATHCPKTCGTCGKCVDAKKRFSLKNGNLKSCLWVKNNPNGRCKKIGDKYTCRKTCGDC